MIHKMLIYKENYFETLIKLQNLILTFCLSLPFSDSENSKFEKMQFF